VNVTVVDGDLLDQPVDAIVNAWNRNVIPWWLLLPQGVSGAIKRRGGTAPFREVARHGPMPLGSAVHTGAGTLPFRGIVHVAGIDLLWRASEASIRDSLRSAVQVAEAHGYATLATPVIGAGSGSFDDARATAILLETAHAIDSPVALTIVRYSVQR
jgi:O-acetyl-ADP-ribose deacetylase